MNLTPSEIAQIIELSAVKAEDDDNYLRQMVEYAKTYHCLEVIPLPSRLPFVKDLLGGYPGIMLGGAVGFPSGGNSPAIKVLEAREQVSLGCDEVDMMINVGWLLSGRYSEVLDDVRAVVEECGMIPVKVILECHYLTSDLILKGCDICIAAGAKWVKTGTGWAPTGATLENIALIKNHVGDRIGVKGAGGIRDLDTLLAMYNLGARRFGLGLNSAKQVLSRAFSSVEQIQDVHNTGMAGIDSIY